MCWRLSELATRATWFSVWVRISVWVWNTLPLRMWRFSSRALSLSVPLVAIEFQLFNNNSNGASVGSKKSRNPLFQTYSWIANARFACKECCVREPIGLSKGYKLPKSIIRNEFVRVVLTFLDATSISDLWRLSISSKRFSSNSPPIFGCRRWPRSSRRSSCSHLV